MIGVVDEGSEVIVVVVVVIVVVVVVFVVVVVVVEACVVGRGLGLVMSLEWW